MNSPRGPAQHGAGGDAHRQLIWIVSRHQIGNLPCPFPAGSRTATSRLVAHVPARMCHAVRRVQISARPRRCSAISAAFSSAAAGSCSFDRGGHAPMPFGAIGFQLRFVGDRADQRMVERVLRACRVNLHLVDELRAAAARRTLRRFPGGQQITLRSGIRSPPRRSMSVWRPGQPVDTRLDRRLHRCGYAHVGGIHPQMYFPRSPLGHRADQFQHDLLGEERVACGPLGDDRPSSCTEGSAPISSPISAVVSESASGARAIVCAPGNPCQCSRDNRDGR